MSEPSKMQGPPKTRRITVEDLRKLPQDQRLALLETMFFEPLRPGMSKISAFPLSRRP